LFITAPNENVRMARHMNTHRTAPLRPLGKFEDRFITANGQERASVALAGATTLWFNTGTLCNIECVNCYIESSPNNDALVYLGLADVNTYLDQISARHWPVKEIGFTGGEPFMNPAMIDMMRASLNRGYRVLVLTNAMRPMMRKKVQAGLVNLLKTYSEQITFRVSLDHYTAEKNDEIRGKGSFEIALKGIHWLRDHGACIAFAGRTLWHETDIASRTGFAALFAHHEIATDAFDPAQTVLFPEMDATVDVPEITTACWSILNKKPTDVMCASSRMVVKRRGAAGPTVLACTLLPYEAEFDFGPDLKDAEQDVRLNHRHCAKFCVLGGASCSS
jgi:hypothetical protein